MPRGSSCSGRGGWLRLDGGGEGLKGVTVNEGLLRRREKRWGERERGEERGERRKYLKSE